MKEKFVLSDYLDEKEMTFDFKSYVKDMDGRIISRASTDIDNLSTLLIDFGFGDWRVTLGSTAHVREEDTEEEGFDCRSLLEVTRLNSDETEQFLVYYDEWDPESDAVVTDTETALMVPKAAIIAFCTLVNSGNLSNKDLDCPFKGLGIKHKIMKAGRLTEHED